MYQADEQTRGKARSLYWQGYGVAEISRSLSVPYGTVDAWKRRDEWDKTPVQAKVSACAEARLMQLIAKEDKSVGDLAEIEALGRTMERMARITAFGKSGKEADLNPAVEERARKRRKKDGKNILTEDQVAALVKAFHDDLFAYQEKWFDAKQYRVRNILKSRQIGATWYFAREALIDAITTGDNQIFLSASKAQAHVFRQYIVQFVADVTGVQLTGDPITLWNGATLYFLGTNSKTAQSYHGHVYLDEYAWIGKFLEFRKVASAMATHKKWRITYFSTPSTIGHQSNAFWTGETFNKGRSKEDRVEFDVSHAALKDGRLCADGQWRQIVTIEDAEAGGCDLFDIKALRTEYNDQDFANLFLAQWVDDDAAYFTFDEMRRCMVDSWVDWNDVNFALARPFGDRPVWVGYDPSKTGDNAAIVVVAPPLADGGKFRVLEKIFVTGTDWQAQAGRIKSICGRYNVTHIGIDSTTIGQGVFQMVRTFYPSAREVNYSVEVKTRLVLKAKQLISRRRLEFDAGWTDVAMAFMAIKRTMTPSGRQATFQAGRSKETGHADVAWAVMHALDKLEFSEFDKAPGTGRGGFVEIY